ncbi:MAG: hypothetical protein RSC93_02025 [Erysipelotrichaceae bacterium]
MSHADAELIKMMFGEILTQEEIELKKLFSEKIEPLYTDDEIREFTKRESEYRMKTFETVTGEVYNFKY